MLDFISELILILSVVVRFTIFKGILTYKKEGRKNHNFVFYILLVFIYITARHLNIFKITSDNNKLFEFMLFSIWAIYYIYFYKISYIKYIVSICLYNVYYDLLYQSIYRVLFILITGYSISSEGALSVPRLESFKIYVYSYILIIILYIIFMYFNKKLQLLDMEKRNYIYLSLALLVSVINIMGRYTLSIYTIGNNLAINSMIYKWKKSVPVLYKEWGFFNQIVVPKLLIGSVIIIIFLFRRIIKENKIKSQNELMQNKLDMQYAHYLSIQESHMKVKKLYHDINNHICCIDKLKNNNDEINEYVNNLKDEIKEFKSIHNTGNMILDIIINEKDKICEKKGIKFICDINFSKLNFVKPIDISSIFSNILDNAIEACDKVNDKNIDKYIRIKGTMTKSYFVLKCENVKVNSIKINKNKFLTEKKDKFIHGIGLQSVKSSLEKYNGELLFEDQKDKFILNIYIPLNKITDSWVD